MHLDEKLTSIGKYLTVKEKDIFLKNYSVLSNELDCILIYRGENKQKLFALYKTSDLTSFSYSLFLIGDKGRNFIKELDGESKKKEKWNLGDVQPKIFRSIFSIINSILQQDCGIARTFSAKNPELHNFFADKKNEKLFVNGTEKKLSPQEKISIRDYYLTLIHQFKDNVFYPLSTLLSVSTDYHIAEKFSGNNHDKIILFGWIPKDRLTDDYTITYKYLNSMEKVLQENMLPAYKQSFYPKEKEVSLKGGLLPHYIIGYQHTEASDTKFEINPAFLNIKSKPAYWILKGLPIKQSGFWKELRRTNFSGAYFVNCSGEYWNEEKYCKTEKYGVSQGG